MGHLVRIGANGPASLDEFEKPIGVNAAAAAPERTGALEEKDTPVHHFTPLTVIMAMED
jgi:hypothetical protein